MKGRTNRRSAALVAIAIAAIGCGRQAHGTADGGAEARASNPDGVNAKDVERFPDERAIDHEAATLTLLATVRVSPPRGEPIVNLPTGTDVQKLSAHGDFLLVSFTSPKTGSRTMGWIPASAIAAPPSEAASGHAHDHVLAHHDATLDGGAVLAVASTPDAGHGGAVLAVASTPDAGHAPHKTCAANAGLVHLPSGDECLPKCKTQSDCKSNSFCTNATLAFPPGQPQKVCTKVSN
jgi:hypothetical protein